MSDKTSKQSPQSPQSPQSAQSPKSPGKKGGKEKAAPKGARLRVKQTRSTSGRPGVHRRTLIALGLRYHQQVIEINDSPAIQGMLHQVRHLIEVTPAGEK